MNSIVKALVLFVLLHYNATFSQEKIDTKKIKISGKIIEKSSNLPLEYATIRFTDFVTNKVITGGITNPKGEFLIEIAPGIYNISYEFISFKTLVVKEKSLLENINLGNITLADEAQKLDDVVIRLEKTTVEIKLDKKVYNVGRYYGKRWHRK